MGLLGGKPPTRNLLISQNTLSVRYLHIYNLQGDPSKKEHHQTLNTAQSFSHISAKNEPYKAYIMINTFPKFQVCATKTLSVAVTGRQISDVMKSLKKGFSSMGDFSQEPLSLIPNTHG